MEIKAYQVGQTVSLTNGDTGRIYEVTYGNKKEPFYYRVETPSNANYTVGHSEVKAVVS